MNQDRLKALGLDSSRSYLQGIEEYAIECSICKVLGTECVNFCANEGVQIYGGMGFSADAPMEKIYRDVRVTRIYEGTNEINRMLIVRMLFKRHISRYTNKFSSKDYNELDVVDHFKQLQKLETNKRLFCEEKYFLGRMKDMIKFVLNRATVHWNYKLDTEYEVLMSLSDMIMLVYAVESAILRTEKLAYMKKVENVTEEIYMTMLYLHNAL